MTRKILLKGEFEDKPSIVVFNNDFEADDEIEFTIFIDDLEMIEELFDTKVQVFEYALMENFQGAMRLYTPEKFADKVYEVELKRDMITITEGYKRKRKDG